MDVITTFVSNFDYTNGCIRLIEFIVHYFILMFCYSALENRVVKNENKMKEMDSELFQLEMKIDKEKDTLKTIYHKIDDLSDFIRNKVILKKNKDV